MEHRMMFFDSYAILEIIEQNEAFLKYEDCVLFTNVLNFSEVYYSLLRMHNKQTADYWAKNLDFVFVDMTKEICMEAAEFKFKHKNRKFSYADCIGYISAIENKMIFLTGDKQFRDMKNVEFVK